MPKVVIQFNLPEEKEDFELANKAGDMSLVLWDFAQFLRQKVKYGNLPEAEEKIYEEVRDKFYEILNDYKVEI